MQVAIAVGAAQEGGECAVEALAHGVGEAVFQVGQDVAQAAAQPLGQVLYRLQAAAARPGVPPREDRQGLRAIGAPPQRPQQLLEGPGPSRLQVKARASSSQRPRPFACGLGSLPTPLVTALGGASR